MLRSAFQMDRGHDKRKDKVAEEDPITNQRLPTFQGETGGGGEREEGEYLVNDFYGNFQFISSNLNASSLLPESGVEATAPP